MKHITISYALLPLLFCISSLSILGEEITEIRAKDREVIVSHVMGIAGNIINLVKEDEKSEDEIGAKEDPGAGHHIGVGRTAYLHQRFDGRTERGEHREGEQKKEQPPADTAQLRVVVVVHNAPR